MAHNAKYTPQNLLLIKGWTGDEKDRELLRILPFLKFLAENTVAQNVSDRQELFEESDCLPINGHTGETRYTCRSKLIRKTADKINQALLKRWENSSERLSLWTSPEHHEWVFDQAFYLGNPGAHPKLKSPTSLMQSELIDLKDARIEIQRVILDEYLAASKEASNLYL